MQKRSKQYPKAKKILLVQDNLNTHTKGAFYASLPAQKAYQLAQRFEFHYTPTKASWLNMVEIELSVIAKQCLDRRIPTMEELDEQVQHLVKERNVKKATVNGQFTNDLAGVKMKNIYNLINA